MAFQQPFKFQLYDINLSTNKSNYCPLYSTNHWQQEVILQTGNENYTQNK